MPTVLGVDIGGTKIAATRFDAQTWESLESKRIDTHAHEGLDHVLSDVEQVISELRDDGTTGIGIGVPGLVRQPDGVVLNMPNIKDSKNADVQQRLADTTGLPVFVENDASCFTLAEAKLGAAKGHRIVVGITMGTGVGGGIVLDGTIYHGATGYASEFGHMLMKPGEPPFETDDKRGEVEQFLSGTAMGKRCEAAGKPEDYLEGEVCEFMRPEIFREVAWLCTNLIHVLDPSIIVFGGSAGRALKPHLSSIDSELKQWTLPGTPIPTLAISELDDAATRGAALLVS